MHLLLFIDIRIPPPLPLSRIKKIMKSNRQVKVCLPSIILAFIFIVIQMIMLMCTCIFFIAVQSFNRKKNVGQNEFSKNIKTKRNEWINFLQKKKIMHLAEQLNVKNQPKKAKFSEECKALV